MSDEQLEQAMQDARQPSGVTNAAVDANRKARVDGLDSALSILAIFAVIALLPTRRIPRTQGGPAPPAGEAASGS
jgi:hypothetical protein